MRAAAAGHLDVVHFLLENGAELVEPDHFQKTALMYAAENGHREVVDLLLEEGEKPGKYDVYRVRKFYVPVELFIRAMGIDRVADERNEAQADKNHALQSAVEGGHIAVIQLLLDKGVSLRSGRYSTSSPLTRASAAGHEEVVGFLLDQEVHHDIKPDDLDDQKNHDDALRVAVGNGHLGVVRLLLEKRADINAVDVFKRTPIIIAAEAGHVEVVRLLLAQEDSIGIEEEKDNGIDEEAYFDEAPVTNHEYALWAAAEGGYVEVVRLLLERGMGAANAIDPYSDSKLEISSIFKLVYHAGSKAKGAKQAAYANILKLFIEHGIKLPEDYKNEDYKKQYPEIVQLVNKRKTAIHKAVEDVSIARDPANIIAAFAGINPDFISE